MWASLVLAFRGLQGGEPQAAWGPGQQQSGRRPQLTGLDSGSTEGRGVGAPTTGAGSTPLPSIRPPSGPPEQHLAGSQTRPLSREGQIADKPCPLVRPEPPPLTPSLPSIQEPFLTYLKVTEIAHMGPATHVGINALDGNNSNRPSVIIRQTPAPHLEREERRKAV